MIGVVNSGIFQIRINMSAMIIKTVLKNGNERKDVDIEEIFNDNDNLKFAVCY